MKVKKVLVAINALKQPHRDALQSAVDGWAECVFIDQKATEADYRGALEQADVAIGWPKPDHVVEAPTRMVQLASVGYDRYSMPALQEKPDFVLCNAAGTLTIPVAEHCLAMMFALTRRLHQHAADKADLTWREEESYLELNQATVCVLGLGDIGAQIATLCASIGMKVIGVTRTPDKHTMAGLDRVVGLASLRDVLPECDHVAACLPSTPETKSLFDAEMIRCMKRGAYIHNVGRGDLIDEPALIHALQNGHLGGAGLDVFGEEPLPTSSPLWSLPNVILTPHVAGRSTIEFDRMTKLFVHNLQLFKAGQVPTTAVINNLIQG